MELEERRALLLNRAMQIALHLPDGWMPKAPTDDMDKDRVRFDHPSGMRFNLTLPHPHTHFHIRVWDWPKMLEYGRDNGGQFSETEYKPNSLNPRRESPEANIALSKSDKRIGDEITTRVLTPYIDTWNLCKIHADIWTETAKKYKRDWEAVCSAAGMDFRSSNRTRCIGGIWVEFERRNSTVQIKMDVLPEQAIQLIYLMNHVEPVVERG